MAAPTVEDFFKPDAYSDIRLSPSGKRLSATIPAPNGRRSLAVVDIDDPKKSRIVAGYSDADIWNVQWVNEDRLVFRLSDQQQSQSNQRGTGLFAADADGKEAPRILIEPSWKGFSSATHINSRTLQPSHFLYGTLTDGTDDVLIGERVWTHTGEPSHVNLFRLNTRTGISRNLSTGAPEHVYGWTVDRQGRPRLAVTRFQGKDALFWKENELTPWVKVDEADALDLQIASPVYIESDSRIYAVARVLPDADVQSLVVMDLSAGKVKPKVETLLSTPGFDFRGGIVRNRSGAVLGVNYATEARGSHWFDPTMKKVQQQVDALLPNTNNLLDCGNCENVDNILVTSTSDRTPRAYRIFRIGKGTIELIASSRPWIRAQEMAATDLVRITTRDGLSMPLYVTRTSGQKAPAPTIVLVHGGPWVRGTDWKWNVDAQFLASRGYVVLEPEYRGSTGYGFKLFRAGWKQWGLAMQDDIADAALWAVKQGHADPKRICLAGVNYGGYSTLMGLIRNPEIFRCGVTWAALTDIDLLYSIFWSDTSEEFQRYGMPTLIGDRTKDAAQLVATSPTKQAAKLKQPLLMVHGGVDTRVPIDHGKQMRDAVQGTNPNVEWKVYGDEGHGLMLPANRIDFWRRIETFLDKNLKNAQ